MTWSVADWFDMAALPISLISVGWAWRSHVAAKRSAVASERSATAAERTVGIEERRAYDERKPHFRFELNGHGHSAPIQASTLRSTLLSNEPVEEVTVVSDHPNLLFFPNCTERSASGPRGPLEPAASVEWLCSANTIDGSSAALVWTARIGRNTWRGRAVVELPEPPIEATIY